MTEPGGATPELEPWRRLWVLGTLAGSAFLFGAFLLLRFVRLGDAASAEARR